MIWNIGQYSFEIEEVVGDETTFDVNSGVTVIRKFQIRQIPQNGHFAHNAYPWARQAFYGYVTKFAAHLGSDHTGTLVSYKNLRIVEAKNKIGEIFDAEIEYSNKKTNEEFTIPTFSIMGGRKKQLLPANVNNAVTRYVKDGDVAIDYKMLGWDGKQFNGIEIETSDLNFMLPAWYPESAVTMDFVKRLKEFVGAVNSEPFWGLDREECKYLGPEQSWVTRMVETGDPHYPTSEVRFLELQHHFQGQLSLEDVEIGDITVPKIPGWAYVDVHYEESLVDIGDGKKIPLAVPRQVDVVKIHKEKDFWELFDGRILVE